MPGRTSLARVAHRRRRPMLVTSIACVSLLVMLPGGAQEVLTRPVLRGYLDRYPAEVAKRLGISDLKAATQDFGLNAAGTMTIDAALDRGYQMWAYKGDPELSSPELPSVAVAEIDLETLKPMRLLKILDRSLALPGPGSVGVQFMSTLDTKNHKLYFQTERGGGFTGAVVRPEIVALDLRTFTHTINELPPVVENGLGVASFFGMEYDEIGDNLILVLPALEGNPTFTANPVSIIGWPASAFDGGPLPTADGMLGPRILRNCRRDPLNAPTTNSDLSTPIMITSQPDAEAALAMKTWVFIPCMTTPVSFNSAIVRLNHSTLFDRNASDERLVPAPPNITNWAIDSDRGRMLLVNESEGSDGWVYEASTNAYIGVIQISSNVSGKSTGFGLDEGSGRLYAFNQSNGLMIAEMGQDPIPQADTYRIEPTGSGWRIQTDVKRNRLFLVAGAINRTADRADRYEIYEVPPPGELQKNETGSLTKQVKEEAGKTTASYGGSATAYGVRSLLAGGLAGAIPSFGNDTLGKAIREINTRCGLKDREVVIASIQQTELQNSGREARALGAYLDNVSVQDLGRPSRCDVYNEVGLGFSLFGIDPTGALQFSSLFDKMDEHLPPPYQAQPDRGYADFTDEALGGTTKWEYRPATCAQPTAQAGKNSDQLAGPTSVSCGQSGLVTARSEGQARQETIGSLVVSVGKASTTTSVKLDPARGLVSEATSVVENFKIGEVTIGYIENRASSFAKGRSGTAGTGEYLPVIAGLRGPNISGCQLRCPIDDATILMLNTALAGRAEFRTLKPDPELLRGSSDGYQSGVIKSEKQRSSDNALVGDKSGEVPALEVIIYNDNPRLGRVRQIIQLAGVHVDSQYGIQVFDDGTACTECAGTFDFGDDLVGDTDTSGDVLDGSDAGAPGGLGQLVRRVIGGIAEGIQLLIANPREAATVATVWALLLGPYLTWRRRRLLGALQS